jgi:hypothetical protein
VKCSLAGPERRACCHGDEAACSLIAKMSDRKNLETYRHTGEVCSKSSKTPWTHAFFYEKHLPSEHAGDLSWHKRLV